MSKGIILIVDDEASARDVLEGLLHFEGYDLFFAENGIQGIEMAKELQPDLILLDVMMPKVDGFEVCETLRADKKLAEVPIILITALDDRDSKLRGLDVGADEFLTKPFDRFELRIRIKTITRVNRYRRLLAERSRFEWLVQQAEEGYLMINQEGLIEYANPQARTFLNLSQDEDAVFTVPFLQVVQAEFNCEPEEAWQNWPVQFEPQVPHYLVRPETEADQAFWLEATLVEGEPQNSTEQYFIRLQNVTDKMITRRLMWSFHGQVSHKLRTPLAHIRTPLEFIRQSEESMSPDETREWLDLAYEGITQLNLEIESIFNYLNIMRFRKLGVREFYLSQMDKLVRDVKANQNIQDVSFTLTLSDPGQYVIKLPYQAMELIMEELIYNAIKFHPEESPQIEIKVSEYGDKNSVRIQLLDDGLHLPPHKLQEIWRPYYQAEKGFSGQVSGMGLGLSMVSSLVLEVGGHCHACNRADKAGLIIEMLFPTGPPVEEYETFVG